jgi:hypothetical protein
LEREWITQHNFSCKVLEIYSVIFLGLSKGEYEKNETYFSALINEIIEISKFPCFGYYTFFCHFIATKCQLMLVIKEEDKKMLEFKLIIGCGRNMI